MILIILLTVAILMAIIFFYKFIKNEFERDRYMDVMKPGDNVNVLLDSNSIETAEIIDIDGETVIVKTVVPKNRVYPNKNGKRN